MKNSHSALIDETSAAGSDRPSWDVLAAALGLFALALVTRVALLGQPPRFDELYHILAARGWLETGEFRIAGGTYDRSWLYTLLVAGVFRLFGEGVEVARLPSVLFGAALAPAVFLWTRSVAGRTAAFVAAFLVILTPVGIDLSQTARFYAPHAFLFWISAIAIYRLAERPIAPSQGVLLAIGTAAALLLATHLQIITLIGLVSLGCWAVLFVLLPMVWRLRSRWAVLGGALAIAIVLLLVLIETGLVAEAWATFRYTPLWLEKNNIVRFYYLHLTSFYPLVTPLLPVAAILAIAHRPRPALFCSVTFLVGVVIQSFAGMKEPRYIYYLMPFFFVLTGLAVEAVLVPLFRRLACETDKAVSAILPGLRPGAKSVAVRSVLGAAVLFAIGSMPAVQQAATHALGRSGKVNEHWAVARPALAPYLAKDSLVLTGDELNALYVLGRYDVLVDASRRLELSGGGGEFAIDPRTGHPVVAEPASVVALVRCSPRGIFVADLRIFDEVQVRGLHGGLSPFVAAKMAGELKGLKPVDLPRGSGLVAYSWEHAPATGPECRRLAEKGLPIGAETSPNP